MKRFAVVGLGRFGSSVAKALAEKGQEVLAIDKQEELVHDIMDFVNKAICLDSTDEKAMRSIGIQDVDVAICGIGTNIEASILVTLLLKDLGIPTIICKAVNEPHKKALMRIGASRVVLPERDMGERIANTIISSDENVLEHILLPGDAGIIEFIPPKEFMGKTLRDIDMRAKYGVNVIAIKKQEKNSETGKITGSARINITPLADDVVAEDDVLVVFGENKKIEKLKNPQK
ncbi:MAG: TrkA family potassium uptake protein [Candidatus Omnitrophica bacterium]|nr:TrkA family potassium uptake protein [Candidatus Omnitrophota bacterium]MBU1128306.1 TrkA family potassium uptake protein [Candidatus Omnitrophota bacterium]MBU1784142.1 TrkA family potassium uptake protein [Candidatus Omnitrophota bacterium]MBU1851273.1 TrkA family potassium uptake protein [Candidatus Omnitrophota bacterium]